MNAKSEPSDINQKIIICVGDPAGIGIEVTLKALSSLKLPKKFHPILVGCRKNIESSYSSLKEKGINHLIDPKNLEIIDMPLTLDVKAGHPNAATGAASFHWLTKASEILIEGKARAMVTAPIAKHAWHKAGYHYPGQTERLAELTKSNNVSMLFTAISPYNHWRLNTLLATTHIPFATIPTHLTREIIISKLDTLLKFCERFKKVPKLTVAGLNPHAGEQGLIGTEEIEWLNAVLKEWTSNHPKIQLDGPLPPDTCWLSSAKAWKDKKAKHAPDGILALYHDQGLIPMKLIAFDAAVNTTLGLPFIRTSPDHGTAFDIAGLGCAKETSMLAAMQAAWDLTKSKN